MPEIAVNGYIVELEGDLGEEFAKPLQRVEAVPDLPEVPLNGGTQVIGTSRAGIPTNEVSTSLDKAEVLTIADIHRAKAEAERLLASQSEPSQNTPYLVRKNGITAEAQIPMPLPSIAQIPPELAFTRVEPPALYLIWPWVLKGLKTVKERIHSQHSYGSMHVRQAVLNNTANLHIVTEDNAPVGFCVLTIQNDPFLLVPTTLHVWVEYCESKSRKTTDFMHQEIIMLGKRLCLKDIQMVSPRDAWARRLDSIGMKPSSTIYALELFPED